MRRKGEDGVGDYDDAFSPVPAASRIRTILSLTTQQNMFTEHIDISQAFVIGLPRKIWARDRGNTIQACDAREDFAKR